MHMEKPRLYAHSPGRNHNDYNQLVSPVYAFNAP